MARAKIIVRELSPVDSDQIAVLAAGLKDWFTPTGLRHMTLDLQFQHGRIAIVGGKVAGFISFFCHEGIGQIGWMGVAPEYQRQGIGRTLLDNVIASFRSAGVNEVRVNTLGDAVDYEPYKRTREFYRAYGFKDFQRIKQDNPECPELLILSLRF